MILWFLIMTTAFRLWMCTVSYRRTDYILSVNSQIRLIAITSKICTCSINVIVKQSAKVGLCPTSSHQTYNLQFRSLTLIWLFTARTQHGLYCTIVSSNVWGGLCKMSLSLSSYTHLFRSMRCSRQTRGYQVC